MKKSVKILTIVVLLLALTAGAVSVTYAWITRTAKEEVGFDVSATGYIVINFNTESETASGTLVPAKVVSGAVENNLVDTTRIYKDGENNPDYIAEGAKSFVFTTSLDYVDASGSDDVSATNNMIIASAVQSYHEAGETDYVTFRDNEVHVELTVTVDGVPTDLAPGGVLTLNGDCQIGIRIEAWLVQVDELTDPLIIEKGVLVVISVASNVVNE